MNREIKFRIFDTRNKKMITNNVCFQIALSVDGTIKSGITGDVLMQYTGLLDKNGNKIFEGDIVNDDELGKGIVVFQSGCFFMMYDADTNMEFLGLKTDKFGRLQEKRVVEIIGNIHDNPELLSITNTNFYT